MIYYNLSKNLEEDPIQGDALGNSCYKVRLKISSKGKGKSGGARVITHVHIAHENVYFLTIYDKSRKADLEQGELESLLRMIKQ
ncbi:type II toxin-antitoxin system RelE/ParE family toxin [Runella salmonicolor]|uniref:type II toxin-antitoxin system RelE/ParE family toxin n=1 Tax=Runella salmonicolor TaxID=2950278 RepID=UPI00286E1FA2|nr:type II toxin-antitoxin system RelE/ParE family toxin [Runella salmonicolor]